MSEFPCCVHCEPEPDSGRCWAVETGHACSCIDCPPPTTHRTEESPDE